MKLTELISKHPFLTYLVVDEIVVCIQNCVGMVTNAQRNNRYRYGMVGAALDGVNERLKKAREKKAASETEPEVEEETEE